MVAAEAMEEASSDVNFDESGMLELKDGGEGISELRDPSRERGGLAEG